MTNRAQKSGTRTASKAVADIAPAKATPAAPELKATKHRADGDATSASKPKAGKRVVAEANDGEAQRDGEVELRESDNRFTSPELIDAIEESFGPIDFDPCWHQASAVAPKAYLDVRRGDDGLRDDWSGRLVFVNPPWSRQNKFIRRAHDQWSRGNVATVVCLVPAKTDAKFFHETLAKDADVYFIQGRPRFLKEDGTSEGTMNSTMLVLFGATAEQKRRLAELVPGSWWLPNRSSPVRRRRSRIRPHHLMYGSASAPRVVSCSACNVGRAVFCGPSVKRNYAG